jgi:PhnB protein
MTKANIYLNFPGTSEEAFIFYKSVFGGEFIQLIRYNSTPDGDGLTEAEKEKIMHISLEIGEGAILMATDALESMGQKLTMGNNVYICLTPDNATEADKLFNGLSEAGIIEMPMEKTFWGSYFGSFIDKFGIGWMIDCPVVEPQD